MNLNKEPAAFNVIDHYVNTLSPQIIVFLGPSASGKDYLLNAYCNSRNKRRIISTTTRPIRDGEVNGVDYWFCNDDEFKSLPLLAVRNYSTFVNKVKDVWWYGVHPKELSTEGCIILDYKGFVEIGNYFNVIGFYLDVDEETRTNRAKRRGSFDIHEWNRRLIDDRIAFKEAMFDDRIFIVSNKETKCE